VDSDWTSVAELIAHGIANDGAAAARKAFLGGVDMDMASSLYHENLAQLVRSGEVPEAAVDEAVRRTLRVKFGLGLFDILMRTRRAKRARWFSGESRLGSTAAERSFVLLKYELPGETPVLPLSADAKTIALIGPLADDSHNMLVAGPGRASRRRHHSAFCAHAKTWDGTRSLRKRDRDHRGSVEQ